MIKTIKNPGYSYGYIGGMHISHELKLYYQPGHLICYIIYFILFFIFQDTSYIL